MKKTVFIIIAVAYIALAASGQDFTTKNEAFIRSYSYEKESKFKEASKELKNIYDEGSYLINMRLGWLAYQAGSYIESMDYYQKAISLKPFAIEPSFGYISPASAAGNWTQVEEQYKKILTIDPMNTTANYWLGMIYYNREQYDLALKNFEKVANLYPFDYDSIIMYAWTNFKMQNLREAKVLFQQALLISPNDASALQGLSLIQ